MKIKDFGINRIKVPLQGCMTAARIVLTLCLSLDLCLNDMFTSSIIGALSSKTGVLVTPLFFLLLYVNRKIDARKTGFKLLFPLVSGFIALIWLMGEGFRIDNTLRALHSSFGKIVKSCVYFAGITYGMNQLAHFLYGTLEKQGATCLEDGLINRRTWLYRIVRAYREHTLLVSFAAVFILWLPHLILSYPTNMCWDAYDQLSQFLGIRNYSNHHPIASTLMMGGLVKIGSLVNGNFGAFFYILVQGIIGAWVLAYTLYLMRELDAPIWLRILSFACYVFVPYYTGYIGMFLKDVPYSFAALLFVSELIYLLNKERGFFQKQKAHFADGGLYCRSDSFTEQRAVYALSYPCDGFAVSVFPNQKGKFKSHSAKAFHCACDSFIFCACPAYGGILSCHCAPSQCCSGSH